MNDRKRRRGLESPVGFHWTVHREAYEIVEAIPISNHEYSDQEFEIEWEANAKPYLLIPVSVSSGSGFFDGEYERDHNPTRTHTGLFREFGETVPTSNDILRFARRHGHLGIEQQPIAWPIPSTPPARQQGHGEAISDWISEVLSMNDAVRVWDMLQQDSVQYLETQFKFEGGRAWFLGTANPDVHRPDGASPRRSLVAAFDSPLESPPAIQETARMYLQQVVNQRVSDLVGLGLQLDRDRQSFTEHIIPRNLLGAMWLQFCRTIAKNKKHVQCNHCGRWLEMAPQAVRKKRFFCSNACRSKSYREKKEEARRQFSGGRSIDDIAAGMQSDPETVRRWIEEHRDRG